MADHDITRIISNTQAFRLRLLLIKSGFCEVKLRRTVSNGVNTHLFFYFLLYQERPASVSRLLSIFKKT